MRGRERMLLKLKPDELDKQVWVNHTMLADGVSYEKNKYTFTQPTMVEMENTNTGEYISFSRNISSIETSYTIPSNIYNISFHLSDETTISITHTRPTYILLHLMTEGIEKTR